METVAQVGDQYYTSLADAINAVDDTNKTVTVLKNISLTDTVEINKNVTIDLNGNDITATDARALWVKSGDVTITGNGKVTTTGSTGTSFASSSSVIRVGDIAANDKAASLTIGANVTVSSDYCYGITVFGNNDTDNDKTTSDITLVVNGKVAVTGSQTAISGNGTNTLSATTMIIDRNAEVTSTNDYAIYHPGKGTLTVNGKVEGQGGIEVKSGTVVINKGATVQANSTTQGHEANNNGTSTSGYAIAAISNSGYVGDPTVTITGGTITGKAIILADGTADNTGVVTAKSNTIATDPKYMWMETGESEKPYKLVEAVVVTFNANNGSETPATKTQMIPKGIQTKLDANTFELENMTFDRWNNMADGTGDKSYTDGESVTLTDDLTLYAQWTDEATEYVKLFTTLELLDRTEIRLYIYGPKEGTSLEDYTVTAEFRNNETVNKPVNEGEVRYDTSGAEYRWFYVASARSIDMADKVTIKIWKDSEVVQTLTTSVQQICEENIKTPGTSQKAITLFTSLLDYGAQAEKLFTNKDEYVNKNYSIGEAVIAAEEIPVYETTLAYDPESGLLEPAPTLNMAESISINVYFKPSEGDATEAGKSLYKFTIDGNEIQASDVIIRQGWYLLIVNGIKANQLQNDHTISVTNRENGKSSSVTMSPLSYAYTNRDNADGGTYDKGNLGHLCKAFNIFSDACIASFGKG